MALAQHRSRKKISGGHYSSARSKRKFEIGTAPRLPRLGERKTVSTRFRGGSLTLRLLREQYINLIDKKTKKATKALITKVVDNPASRNFVRRNILTKGTVVETEKGKAVITSRPGQEGTLNGVLI